MSNRKLKPVNYDRAAYRADWTQVALNGGPPCFHMEDGEADRFCLRAERWAGHTDSDKYPNHRFVSLAALLDLVRGGGEHSKHPTGDYCVYCRAQWPCEESGGQ